MTAAPAVRSETQPDPERRRSLGRRGAADIVFTASAMFAPAVSRERSLSRFNLEKLACTIVLPEHRRQEG